MNNTAKFLKNFFFGLFGAILLFLFVISVIGSCTVNSDEILSYQKDNLVWHILFLGAAWLAGGIALQKLHFSIQSKYFYIILGVFLFALVYFTRLWPKGDSWLLLQIAEHIAKGNYIDFSPGEYLYNQPHQIPLAYVCAALYALFGQNYIFVYQAANCLFTVGVIYLLQKFYQKLNGKISAGGFLLLSVLFVPFLLYVTFVYGTTPGLFFALAACLELVKYLEGGRFYHIALCAVLITSAKLLKSNYLIFCVGFVVILFYDFIRKKNLLHLWAIFILAVSIVLSGFLVKTVTQHKTGIVSKGGIPYVLYVAMGLQEGTLGPGWWSGYHNMVFVNYGCDADAAAECGWRDLMKSLTKMKKDPAYGADFLFRKLSSEWSEPTYESIWIQQNRTFAAKKLPRAVNSLLSPEGKLSGVYVVFCNFFQSFLYFFSLLFVIGRWKKITASELIFPVIFIGGFLFHIFWEAKGQYTLPYCVCLLPMCVWGYGFVLRPAKHSRTARH